MPPGCAPDTAASGGTAQGAWPPWGTRLLGGALLPTPWAALAHALSLAHTGAGRPYLRGHWRAGCLRAAGTAIPEASLAMQVGPPTPAPPAAPAAPRHRGADAWHRGPPPPPERRCPHRGCGKGAPMTPGWDLFESIVGQRHLAFLPVTVQRKLEPPEQGGIVVLKILGCPLPWPRPGGTGTQGCPREPPPPALAQASGVQGYPRGLALSLRAMGSPCFSRTHLRSLRDPHQPHVGHVTRKSTAHPPRPEPGVPATLHGQAAFVSPEKENK